MSAVEQVTHADKIKTRIPVEDPAALDAFFADLLPESTPEVRAVLVGLVSRQNKEITRLAAALAALRRGRSGGDSEKIGREQMVLFAQLAQMVQSAGTPGTESEAPASSTPSDGASSPSTESDGGGSANAGPKAKEKQKPRRRPLSERFPHLEVRDEIIQVDDRSCAICGLDKVCIGHDTSEVLEYEPPKFYILHYLRERLACPEGCEPVAVAPPVDKVFDGGIPGPGGGEHRLAGEPYPPGHPVHQGPGNLIAGGEDLVRRHTPIRIEAQECSGSLDVGLVIGLPQHIERAEGRCRLPAPAERFRGQPCEEIPCEWRCRTRGRDDCHAPASTAERCSRVPRRKGGSWNANNLEPGSFVRGRFSGANSARRFKQAGDIGAMHLVEAHDRARAPRPRDALARALWVKFLKLVRGAQHVEVAGEALDHAELGTAEILEFIYDEERVPSGYPSSHPVPNK